ncbi:MAG: hypothetical protein QM718_11030 [Steroidobacteraceae bacterium]
MRSDAFVRGLRGPIGSGKSTSCIMEILRRSAQQPKGHDGWRRSRWAIIRNTFPELKTTTIKSWHLWVPKEMGRWVEQGPPSHHIRADGIDLEVIFLALDSPEDIKKLLSLDLTGAWINEAREVPKAVLDQLTGRVGRYPAALQGGAGWSGIIMDTNSPDDDHWWYRLSERETPEGFAFFSQPSALSPQGENLNWLLQTDETLQLPLNHPDRIARGRLYYERQVGGKSEEWIKIYIRSEYGFIQEGRAVYPEYRDSIHCKPFELALGLPLYVGVDFGLTPAAIIGQRSVMGSWRWRYEFCAEHMGAKRFGELVLKPKLDELTLRGFKIEAVTGDPAGDQSAQTDENTPFRILRGLGIPIVPAPTNDFSLRREAVAGALSRLVDGEPGLIVHPECAVTRRGMGGRYAYKRIQIAGDERYHDKPDKNAYSHPCEAGQYMLLGGGETRAVLSLKPRPNRPRYAVT